MRGVDSYRRPFVTIKVSCVYDGKDKKDVRNKTKQEMVVTFFQRYSDNEYSWAYGHCYEQNVVYWDSRVRPNDTSDITYRLKKLLSGESIRSVDFYCSDNTRPLDTRDGNGA